MKLRQEGGGIFYRHGGLERPTARAILKGQWLWCQGKTSGSVTRRSTMMDSKTRKGKQTSARPLRLRRGRNRGQSPRQRHRDPAEPPTYQNTASYVGVIAQGSSSSPLRLVGWLLARGSGQHHALIAIDETRIYGLVALSRISIMLKGVPADQSSSIGHARNQRVKVRRGHD